MRTIAIPRSARHCPRPGHAGRLRAGVKESDQGPIGRTNKTHVVVARTAGTDELSLAFSSPSILHLASDGPAGDYPQTFAQTQEQPSTLSIMCIWTSTP